jgi:hypothetical protein
VRLQFRSLMALLPLVLATLLVLGSPLPEMLMGRLLDVDNASRGAEGRAHERSALARTGEKATGELRAALEAREREASQLTSLAELKRYLFRYGSASLTLPAFLRWYNALPDSEAVGVIQPMPLLGMVYGGRAASVDFQLRTEEDTASRLIAVRILDERKLVIHESTFDEQALRASLRDLEAMGSGPESQVPRDVGLRLTPGEWVARPESLPDRHRATLSHLLLDPDLDIRTLYLSPDDELYIETFQDSTWSLFRLRTEETREGWRLPWLGG